MSQILGLSSPVSAYGAVMPAGDAYAPFGQESTASVASLSVSASNLAFGNETVNSASAAQTVTLTSSGTAPVTVTAVSIHGNFAVSGSSFPLTLNPGTSVSLSVDFYPLQTGSLTGKLEIVSNSTTNSEDVVALSGTGVAAGISSLNCASGSFSAAGTDVCTVTLGSRAGSGGQTVALSSSSSAVTVPATVTVASNASSASFAATVAPVTAAQTATLAASTGSSSASFAVQLAAAPAPQLNFSSSNVAIGSVAMSSSSTQTVTMSSTGNVSVTVTSAVLAGSGFTMSGVSFPVTLTPGQSATLNIQFVPTVAGTTSGQLTITSNSSTNGTEVISLSGTGTVLPSAVSCANATVTGAGTDACTVTLNSAAPAGGQVVNLTSGSTAVTVPSSVTLAAGSTSASFTATVSSVATAQTAALTATANGASSSFSLQLAASAPALSINASSVAFGTVTVNTPSTQTVTLSSTGNAAVTVNAATISGTGFTMSGATFPLTLTPGQTVSLSLQFDPAAAGAASGQLAISSNSSANGTVNLALTGTGQAASYAVQLSWDAPSGSAPVAGYNIYRAMGGSTSYKQLNSSVNEPTTFQDSTVSASGTYTYIVETVSASGLQSLPSNTFQVVVP